MGEGEGPPRDRATDAPGAGGESGGRRRIGRSAGVALATLSTVVGLATGVITLGDEIFPGGGGEGDEAAVVGGPANGTGYREAVGAVCDAVNEDDEARADQDRDTDRRLDRATTFGAQRDALVDGNHAITTRTSATLARFAQLTPPRNAQILHQRAERRWQRTVERLRDEGTAFEDAQTTADLKAALQRLGGAAPGAEADRRAWRDALTTLGGDACELEPPVDPATLTLPPSP
ncbi:MAG TPA: hypothetical protein VN238_07770 [Solirubrobacteraceae bacterium]|nr:hypothetical protein [Solirubrobacteraceae bacterium]